MAHFFAICLILAMASEMVHGMVEHNVASFTSTPAIRPSHERKLSIAEAPAIRKLGRHQPALAAPCLSPSEGPQTEEKMHSREDFSSLDQENGAVPGQEMHILEKHHHSVDKSIAGGGVILGGLATTFLVAVFCYIRATGRKNSETSG
ncbi:uncharacterized protein LOC132315059 [Cornus florida]|uniref:uncharacterized protein LOC132315059 n=1 Tax=Cornus florida TaxID=4283 RepID=UPI00289A17A4|nr:uncharacterized protein LOC132315059 [Cornus florida]